VSCGLGAAILAAQTQDANPLPAANPVIRVSVNLVQVDAVVTDAKDDHITDLQPDDFEILEDGRPQKITNFSFVQVKPGEVAPPPARPGAAAADPPRTLRKEEVHRSIVLMVDDFGTEYRDVIGVIGNAKKFVNEQMAPGDLVAVTASHGGMGFYQQFTSDKRQLLAAIDHLGHRPGMGQGLIWNLVSPPRPIGYLRWAIEGLQDVPGRKAIVILSHNFPAVPPFMLNLANRSGVVIYVVNPSGFVHDNPDFNPEAHALARQTGGLYIMSWTGRDLTADLGRVMDDMSSYYLLGYQPNRSDFDLSQGRPVHHDIQVKVRRPDLTVRARSGFMGVPDPGVKPAPKIREEFLARALFSPFSANGIRLRLDPLYAASEPDPKTRHRLPVLHAMVSIDGNDVRFADGSDGKKKLVIDVVVGVYNQDGTRAGSRDQRFEISATPDEVARLAVSGIGYTMDVKLTRPGPYQIRAAVRDVGSGIVGSAYSFVEIPDFNKSGIVLSSVALSSAPAGTGENDTGSLGWSKFTAGAKVHFACEVFGVTPARPPGEPEVEMEVRLFREGNAVLETPPLAVSPGMISGEHLLAGDIQLSNGLVPGDYAMQLVAYDRLAPPKKQIASQWIDLTIVKPSPTPPI